MGNLAEALAIVGIAVCITIYYVKKLGSSHDVADEIRKLADLEKEGAITKEEFDKKKKTLLGR